VGITAGSREVPGRNACVRRHTYCIIIIIIIIIRRPNGYKFLKHQKTVQESDDIGFVKVENNKHPSV